MPIDERRKIREIRQRLNALNVSELDMVVKGVQQRHGQQFIIELANVREERTRLGELLEVYETRALIREAAKFGIDVPYKREWFAEVMPDPYDPDTKHELALDRLNELGRATVTRQIWDRPHGSHQRRYVNTDARTRLDCGDLGSPERHYSPSFEAILK